VKLCNSKQRYTITALFQHGTHIQLTESNTSSRLRPAHLNVTISSKLLIKTVLGSLDEIFLLSTNKPNTATLDALITSCQVHNHHFIIESEFMREKRLNASLNYIDFNNQVRTQLGLHIIETVSSQ